MATLAKIDFKISLPDEFEIWGDEHKYSLSSIN